MVEYTIENKSCHRGISKNDECEEIIFTESPHWAAYRFVQRKLVVRRDPHRVVGETDEIGKALLHVIGPEQSVRRRGSKSGTPGDDAIVDAHIPAAGKVGHAPDSTMLRQSTACFSRYLSPTALGIGLGQLAQQSGQPMDNGVHFLSG